MEILEVEQAQTFRHGWRIFFGLYFIGMILDISTGAIVHFSGVEPIDNAFIAQELWLSFILVSGIAPLIETFFFQFGMTEIYLFFKEKNWQAIIFSAVIFALAHTGNSSALVYLGAIFMMGIYLGWIYLFYKSQGKNAFWYTCLLHAMINSTVLLLKNF